MNHDYRGELGAAVRAATAVGALLRGAFHSGESQIDRRAEEEIRHTLNAAFPQYGYHGEELGLVSRPGDPGHHLWLVDPDDGTSAFEKGFRGASVSIALLRNGEPVLGVVYAYCAPDDAGDWFTWAEGTGPLRRNGREITTTGLQVPQTALVSHHGDRNPLANALAVAPMRFRAVPSIAYRLALVAAGEACAAVSLNGPVGWDYAGGHALLLGSGMDLYDHAGRPIRYDPNGTSGCGGRCFGGSQATVQRLVAHKWNEVLRKPSKRAETYGLCWPKRGCTIDDPRLLSRAQGCLLGQLAGDALGAMVEFKNAASIRRMYPAGVRTLEDGGYWNTLGGQPTDDSEMALILARSILQGGGYDSEAAARAYTWWFDSHPFDCVGTTAAALSAASRAVGAGQSAAPGARSAAQCTSQANGALMRISPLGIFASALNAETAAEWARADALLTHPNPVCQAANSVYVQALAFAIRTGAGPEQTYRFAWDAAKREHSAREVADVLEGAGSSRPEDYTTHQGWVLIALQNAFWQLLHAGTLEEGVVNTVMSGGDTDTNAAIAGALLGAVHGRDAIPVQWTDRVLSCRPISGFAGVKKPRPEAFWPVDALWIAERLLWVGRESEKLAPRSVSNATSPAPSPVGADADRTANEKQEQRTPDPHWNGVIHRITSKSHAGGDGLLPALEARDWGALLRLVRETPTLVNTVYRKGRSTFHLLHEVARRNAPADLVHELVRLGAFRTVADSAGQTPIDVAMKNGAHDLAWALQPTIVNPLEPRRVAFIQELFHGLIRAVMLGYNISDELWLPQLSILTEAKDQKIWFPIPGMYGGFHFWLEQPSGPVLIADHWCRVFAGSDMRHRITPTEVILVEEGQTAHISSLSMEEL
jgi:ADP-ribosyl-[dinitrogen reductase] hydrolase